MSTDEDTQKTTYAKLEPVPLYVNTKNDFHGKPYKSNGKHRILKVGERRHDFYAKGELLYAFHKMDAHNVESRSRRIHAGPPTPSSIENPTTSRGHAEPVYGSE